MINIRLGVFANFGQTDGQTEFSSLDRVCIICSAVINGINLQ